MRMWVQSLASLSGLRIQHCCELWHRSQTWLGSHIAVALAYAAAIVLIGPLAWKPPYAAGVALRRQKDQKKIVCVCVCVCVCVWH